MVDRPSPSRRRTAVLATGAAVAVLAALVAWQVPADERARPPDSYLLVERDALLALPTAGPAWEAVREAAEQPPQVDLEDQDSTDAAAAVAAALVHARTGDEDARERVVDRLDAVARHSGDEASVLSLGRQLAGYLIAADLVGYRTDALTEFVDEIPTRTSGNHGRWRTLVQTSESTSSNWGAWALASRVAAAAYLEDEDELARTAVVLRAALGDREALVFEKTQDFDPSYVCGDPDRWSALNAAGCGALDGALVEDISRSAGPYPHVDRTGLTYSWETMGGLTLAADLLARHGQPDVHQWGDRALLRAARFLERHGGYPPPFSTNQYIPWRVNKVYDVDLGPIRPAGSGRQYGFTDWLP